MGSSQSSPGPVAVPPTGQRERAGPSSPAPEPPVGCPMNQAAIRECPVQRGGRNQEPDSVDPLNMMPPPNQRPSPGQPFSLNTERQVSNIPRAGTGKDDEKWVFPSEQMFWNAMLRKGWRWDEANIGQKDMEAIIRIHNMNNEAAWEEVMKWEAFHRNECPCPKLLKLQGDAKAFTPKARFWNLFGYDLPFDRHDWIIDRCGKQVHYVLDFYDIGGPKEYKTGEFIYIDVRPALDSFEAVYDRTRVFGLQCLASVYSWIKGRNS